MSDADKLDEVSVGGEQGIRVWPGILIVVLQWIVTFGSGIVAAGTMIQFFGIMAGPIVGLLALLLWWRFGSRAPQPERRLGLLLPPILLVVAFFLVHRSMPMALLVYGIPSLCQLFVGWVVFCRRWAPRRRQLAFVVLMLLGAGLALSLRTTGVDGDMGAEFAWRWQQTAEERFLASAQPAGSVSGGVASAAATRPGVTESDLGLESEASATVGPAQFPWPGFRGPRRDGVITGISLATDWQQQPPQELWRRQVGPGWSSVAIGDGRLYTQEQRGEEEVVSAYDAATGEPLWLHGDTARFWEALAGTGPRGTPTLHGELVLSLGATGVLNALRAQDGSVVWQRDLAADASAEVPEWGFASSPLVVDGLVVVYSGNTEGKGVVAYDLLSGQPRWFAPAGALSYSSLHELWLDGERQLIMSTGDGITSLAPEDGEVLWEHEWPTPGGARVVQPVLTQNGDLLVGTGFGMGMRRLQVSREAEDWQVREAWTSRGLKPYFNDFVVYEGHAYGFDGRIMSCIELTSGERQWKGGRYGHGQVLLLQDQGVLLVLTERGEIALVSATPSAFTELTKVPAIEGKTWNHPVLVDDVLYLRNGEEMAAYRMPVQSRVAAGNP